MAAHGLIEEGRNFIGQTSASVFVRDRVLSGACRMLESIQHAKLREEVASHFNIHTQSVLVVGSAKLGYSVSPNKLFKPFGDTSDIDIAIIDSRLFETFWIGMHDAQQNMVEWPELSSARKYLFRGWIRPDKLPIQKIRNQWFDFFNDLQSRGIAGEYAIRAGLYFNAQFLETYQIRGVRTAFSEI